MKRLKRLLHHYFIPSTHNNFRAKGLHLDTLVFILMIVMTVNTISDILPGKILGYATDVTIEKLLARTNQERTSQGLPPLRYNDKLAHAACNKAQDMFTYNYWAHYRPGDGTAPWHFIKQSGYAYEFAGENLAQGFLFSDGVVDGWMNSPTHRSNILRAEYDDIGFCVLNGVLQNEETTLVVQMFGKPTSPQAPLVEQVNAAELPQQTPEPVVEKNLEKILTQNPKPEQKISEINFAAFSFNSSFTIVGLLLLILAVDLYVALRLKIVRVSGKNLAHWLFLGSIALALLIVKTGVIL